MALLMVTSQRTKRPNLGRGSPRLAVYSGGVFSPPIKLRDCMTGSANLRPIRGVFGRLYTSKVFPTRRLPGAGKNTTFTPMVTTVIL
ncbi:hypothetical protein TcasGA2_TC034697 [Tribolium castaneum]|uniref:Uncharacterized protein n=1 Tax=Tribolium castaneum TaxID=7070 RepID=A0A139WHB2_TRICA|nr:hypothetical protein TcasGA2_TC034697 [Tribolium castaneum]